MYITNKERNDGFGAQYQTIIFTILFCDIEGYKFVYRPFDKMEHNYDSDPFFLEKKEKFINIKSNYPLYDSINKSEETKIDLSIIYRKIENNLDYCLNLESFHRIKELFLKDKTKKESEKYAAIHIRRPNRFDIGDYGYDSDDYFINAIDFIRENYSDIKKIKIYSQGKLELFSNFLGDDIELHLNESIEETFSDLVFSDILVLSKGSFSYCAGLLCDGIVYYIPFWHKPKKTWLKF
jgi:hypothetical protein